MSSPLPSSCANCANPKNVHLTQIVGDELKKLSLCASCPAAQGAAQVGALNIVCESNPKLALDASAIQSSDKTIACPNCGFTQESFKEYGRLGCPACYDAFASGLDPVLKKAHKGTEHRGKVPAGYKAPVTREEIEALKTALQKHVDREEYEEAAQLRDRIWEMESRVS